MEKTHMTGTAVESDLAGPSADWSSDVAASMQPVPPNPTISSLADVAADAAQRGQRATAEYEGKMLSGTIVAIGIDYVTLRLGEQDTETRLDPATWTFASTDAAPSGPNTEPT